jgi:hypothetical protein
MATGVGLLDQQNSFFGKVLLHIAVFGILLFRTSSDVEKYKNLVDEATFYDKQWSATCEPCPASVRNAFSFAVQTLLTCVSDRVCGAGEGQERPSDN